MTFTAPEQATTRLVHVTYQINGPALYSTEADGVVSFAGTLTSWMQVHPEDLAVADSGHYEGVTLRVQSPRGSAVVELNDADLASLDAFVKALRVHRASRTASAPVYPDQS